MKNLIYLLIVSILILVLSCKEAIDNKLLIGDWTAIEILENDAPIEIDLKSIKFSFYENNTYEYQGIMLKEAGNYYLSRDLLYSTDTLKENSKKKAVKVIKSTADSLFFEMNDRGTMKIIKLYKTN